MNFSSDEINFVDTTIKIKKTTSWSLHFTKNPPTDTTTYTLNPPPRHIFKLIIFSQAVRYNRIFSDRNDRESCYI